MVVPVIVRLTLVEASRRKILIAALMMGVLFLLVFLIGFRLIYNAVVEEGSPILVQRQIGSFLLMAGLYAVNFLAVMMTVLTSVDTLSGEISSGRIHTILSKPTRRWEVLTGKWLGFAIMITLYLLMMVGGVMLITYVISGVSPPHPLKGFGLMWLEAMLLLTVSFFGGSILSTLANGVLVFGLYGMSFIGGWIEQIGTFFDEPARSAAINVGIVTSLIMPGEALWKSAAAELQSPLMMAIGSPFDARSVPSPLFIGYAVLYMAVIFTVTVRVFSKKDL